MVLILQILLKKNKYEKDGSDFEDKINKIDKKIPDVSNLVTKSSLTAVENKIPDASSLATTHALTAVENKIPDVSSLATTSSLTAVENKIPDITSLVKKTDFNSKITEVEGKIPSISGLATTSGLTAVENKIPNVTSLVTIDGFDAKIKAISDRVTKIKSKDLLLDNELKKLKAFDTDYFVGANYFEGCDGVQNMLVFHVKNEFFGLNSSGNTQYCTWKSKGISDENFYYNGGSVATKLTRPMDVSFDSNQFFFQDPSKVLASFVVNVYICYKLLLKTINTDNALKNCFLVQWTLLDLIVLKILIILFTLGGELVLITMKHLIILKVAQLET